MQQHPWFSDGKTGLIQVGRPFVKIHGLRNDFVIADGRKTSYTPCVEEIIHICDRHEGIGADELLVVEPPRSGNAYAFLRIINPDGCEVEACGNASRCVGWLLLQESGHKEITIETLGGQLKCRNAGDKLVAVEMGRLRTVWERPGVLTTACGTGACVAVAAAHRRGLTTEKCMTVIMPAGSVEIELKESGTVVMTGPVETCYAGYLPVTG